jgi:hypothetical protein
MDLVQAEVAKGPEVRIGTSGIAGSVSLKNVLTQIFVLFCILDLIRGLSIHLRAHMTRTHRHIYYYDILRSSHVSPELAGDPPTHAAEHLLLAFLSFFCAREKSLGWPAGRILHAGWATGWV